MSEKYRDITLDPLTQRYLDMLCHERKLSPHTLAAYRRDLVQLQSLATHTPLLTLSQHQIRLFTTQLHSKGLAPPSIARILSTWRGFYTWLGEQNTTLPINPVIGIRAPRHTKRLPKALSVEHAVALAEHIEIGIAGVRDHAICELFYSSGLRLSELVQLDWRYFSLDGYQSRGWLDLESKQVTILGKGNKQRTVPVGSRACIALYDWLKVRPQISKHAPDPYAPFLSPRGGRIHHHMVYLRIKALARAAGIPADVHPHVLRHSFASHILQSSGDLRAVQDLLGHASIVSTQIYTALDFQHLSHVYDAAHPRAHRKTSSKKKI